MAAVMVHERGERRAAGAAMRAGIGLLAAVMAVAGCSSRGQEGTASTPGLAGKATTAARVDTELARVGEKSITLAEYRQFYQRMPDYLQSTSRGVDKERNHLQTLVDMELLRLEAVAEGLDRAPALLRKMEQYRRERLVGIYQTRHIRVRITDEEVRDYYAEKGLSRRVRFGQIVTDTEDAARAALREVEGGRTFQEVAAARSVDAESAARGGDTGRYVSRLDMPPALADRLFALQAGELSEPLHIGALWFLFSSLDHLEAKIDDEAARAVYQGLFIQRSSKERAALADSLSRAFHLGPVRDGLESFAEAMRRGAPRDAAEVRGIVLYRHDAGQVTAGDLLDAADPSTAADPDLRRPDAVMRHAEITVVPSVLFEQAALRDGLDREEQVARWLASKRDEELLIQLRVQVLDERIAISDDAVRRHYEENPERYMRPERIRVQEVLVGTEEEARDLLRRVQAGEALGELARRHSRRSSAQRDEEGRFTLTVTAQVPPALGALVTAARKAREGELGGPVRGPDGYSVFRILSRTREPATFAESATRARATLYWIEKQKVFERYLEELRAKYADRVQIRHENLAALAAG
ncbi:MAG: peptidyl-prolyl cis-trans isomerase [Candidatus Latescibacterota bacterium]